MSDMKDLEYKFRVSTIIHRKPSLIPSMVTGTRLDKISDRNVVSSTRIIAKQIVRRVTQQQLSILQLRQWIVYSRHMRYIWFIAVTVAVALFYTKSCELLTEKKHKI